MAVDTSSIHSEGLVPYDTRNIDDALPTNKAVGREPAPGPARMICPTKSASTATQFKTPSTLASALEFGIMVGDTRASMPLVVLAATARSLMR